MSLTSIFAIVLGIIVCAGALVLLIKERADAESVKIYGIAAGVAAIVAVLGATGIIA